MLGRGSREVRYENMKKKMDYTSQMRSLRRRRLFLWALIAIYIPMMWLVLHLGQSDRVAGVFFGIWVVVVALAANLTAFCRCPACGNFFHMNGPIPMYLRHCLHCGMHISGDERRNHFHKEA